MELSATIISLTFLTLVFFGHKILLFLSDCFEQRHEAIHETYEIEYPDEPVEDNFQDVMKEIAESSDVEALKMVYIRIIIFQGTYPDSGKLLSALMEAYNAKEAKLMSTISIERHFDFG